MAEELNKHSSSVFTGEETSSFPILETKFNGSEGERLGQLVVTPEVIPSKISNIKENKSPRVDGISPKILKETVVNKQEYSQIAINYFDNKQTRVIQKCYYRPTALGRFRPNLLR